MTPEITQDKMNKITRTKCALTGVEPTEILYTFKNFPISMSCVTTDRSEDIFEDMTWGTSPSNHVQLVEMLDPDLIYKNYHNPGTIGKTWQDHHQTFADFIQRDKFSRILEIGGASGSLAANFVKHDNDFKWTIIEPSPQTGLSDPRVELINGYFKNYPFDSKFDTIVHSHCFEHVYDPISFLNKVNSLLDFGDFHYISIPNMHYWLANGFTNTLSFEHTFYVDVNVLTYLLSKTGFKVVDQIVGDHSVFVKAEKVDHTAVVDFDFTYVRHLFEDYITQLTADVAAINDKIGDKEFYLFGGHIFSQCLLNMGLTESQVVCILDNDTQKQGKRLYGTDCLIKSPSCLAEIDSPIVVLRGGSYNDEIKESILNINTTTVFV